MNDIKAVKTKTVSERKSVLYVVLILLSVGLLAAVIIIWKLKSFSNESVCSTKECLKSSFFLLDLLDPNVDPCDNFYNFTCGNCKGHFLIHNFQNEVNKKIRALVTSPIQEEDSRSVKLQKQYYQACMDVIKIEDDQNETLRKYFIELGGWPVLMGRRWHKNQFEWGKVIEKCKEFGFYYDWFINIRNIDEIHYENRFYITIPDNVNEIEDVLKNKYLALMTNVAVILGAPGNLSTVTESMNRVMEFEIGLLKIINDPLLNKTDQEYTMEDIRHKYPNIPWTSLLKNVILPINEKIIFNLDDYIPRLETYLNKTDKRVQANYIFWKVTESFSAFLTFAIRKEFEAYADLTKHYHFPKERENYCYGITNTVFAYVSEAEFARKRVTEKASVQKLVNDITAVLNEHIDNAKWMNEAVKNAAFEKIENMSVIIGGMDEMYDEDQFNKFLGIDQINLNGLNNTMEIILEVDKRRDLFNLDFSKPKLTVKQAELYRGVGNLGYIKYIPSENIMFIPAAALGGIFYSQERANYLNYGAIGTVIGHELAHGFGIITNLVFDDDVENIERLNFTLVDFLESAKCLLEDCNNIGVENTINMHCQQTFKENFADYAGINLSYEAYLNLEEESGGVLPGLEYTPKQLFWIIYSTIMCNNIEVTKTEGLIHMLPFQRILGSFRNSDYFGKDFNCPIGSNMNPEVKCKIL